MTAGEPVQVPLAAHLAALTQAEHPWDLFAILRSCRELTTKDERPYLALELSDVHAVLEGKVWNDRGEAMKAARSIPPDTPVKVRAFLDTYRGRNQLRIVQIRPVEDPASEEGFEAANLYDPALDLVGDLACSTLVIDIETVPAVERRQLPPTVAESLAKHAERKEMEPGAVMGMSPFFGKVVSLAVGDGDSDTDPNEQAVNVLVVPPEGMELDAPDWVRPMSEPDLLRAFWALASRAEVVVTYNGRGFDVPFLATRSLIHRIPARVDLLSNRFSLRPHLDLFDVLGQRGRGPSSLDVVCWALGIESPKGQMDGSMVAPAYARGDILEIARYNAHDVRATTEVFQRVRDELLCYRADW